ncbi:MAG: hypothetical protein ACI9WU_002953 [Myxococcota bacterium]|jgi:hypothetical protein
MGRSMPCRSGASKATGVEQGSPDYVSTLQPQTGMVSVGRVCVRALGSVSFKRRHSVFKSAQNVAHTQLQSRDQSRTGSRNPGLQIYAPAHHGSMRAFIKHHLALAGPNGEARVHDIRKALLIHPRGDLFAERESHETQRSDCSRAVLVLRSPTLKCDLADTGPVGPGLQLGPHGPDIRDRRLDPLLGVGDGHPGSGLLSDSVRQEHVQVGQR